MTLEMSSLFSRLKSNNSIVSTDDLILIMLGWFFYLWIAFKSGSSDNLSEVRDFLMFIPLVLSLK